MAQTNDLGVTAAAAGNLHQAAAVPLTSQDLANLVIEAVDTPMHMAVLTILDGATVSRLGEEDLLARARQNVAARLDRLPELRQRLCRGRAPVPSVWVDDPQFDIRRHVMAAAVSAPGGEAEVLATVETRLETLLDRSRPLWELWLLTGLRRGRCGLLLKVHHALTDGLGMLRIADVLFDVAPRRGIVRAQPWTASPRPPWLRLVAAAAGDGTLSAWRVAQTMLDPVDVMLSAAAVATTLASITRRTWAGRRAPLRHPLGRGRRLAVLRLDVGAVKRVAHAHGAKVNDVVLELAAAGVGGALRSRGESTRGVVLRTLVAVNQPAQALAGRHNTAGAVVVSLPVDASRATDRLHTIALDSRRARRWQRSQIVERFVVLVTRTGLARFLSRHQAAIELAVSNLRGPSERIYFLGCPVLDAVPVTPISGNVTIDFCALSYARRFNIGVLADAASWPDLELVVESMRAAWLGLRRPGAGTPAA